MDIILSFQKIYHENIIQRLIVFLFSISYYFRYYPEESTKYWNANHTLLKEKLTQPDEIAPTNHSYLTVMDRWVHVSRHKDYRYCSI